jgi:hypothetical protein
MNQSPINQSIELLSVGGGVGIDTKKVNPYINLSQLAFSWTGPFYPDSWTKNRPHYQKF